MQKQCNRDLGVQAQSSSEEWKRTPIKTCITHVGDVELLYLPRPLEQHQQTFVRQLHACMSGATSGKHVQRHHEETSPFNCVYAMVEQSARVRSES